MGPIGCPETSGRNYRSTLRNTQNNADLKIWQQYNLVKSKHFECYGGTDKQQYRTCGMQLRYAIKRHLGQLLHTWGKTIDIAKKMLENLWKEVISF